MADAKTEETEEQPAAADTEDELEQDEAGEGAEEGAPKQKSKEEQEKEAKNRKADSAKILAGGDFQVQIHVIEGRDLTGKDAGGTSDPVVTITIFDEKKSTKIKNKTKNPRWDQVLYFELNKLEPDQLSHGKALIQVFDADIISRNDLIGAFEFDLSWIYYREHHEVYNQWIALTNPDADNEEEEEKEDEGNGMDGIEGYLKLSVTILGPGDEQYIHDEEEELAKESSLESGMILISPGIEQTPHLLTVTIYEAANLCKTDDDTIFSKMAKNTGDQNLDPFFYVEFAGCRRKSKVHKGVSSKDDKEFAVNI